MSGFFTMSIEQKKNASHCWTALWLFGHCFMYSPAFGAFCSKVRSKYDEIFFRQLSKSKNIQETPVTDPKKIGMSDSLKLRSRWSGGSAITVARILPRL